jgi:peptidoglycan/LPS O-acetylase OafA/YrhL
MKSSAGFYFSRLDHLRLLAALMVLAWHGLHANGGVPYTAVPSIFLGSLFEEGHTGVALFITLSGFLFAALTDQKQVDYAAFVRNRLLRIAPLFVIWTLFAFYTSQVPPERLFAVIFALLDRHSYPHVGWTVLVEFQLYLVFPFLLQFRRRFGLPYLAGVIGVCMLIRVIAWASGGAQDVAYFTVFGRADQFILGMVAFEAYKRYQRPLGAPLIFFPVFLGLAYAYHVFNKLGGFYDFGHNSPASTLWIFFPTLEGLAYGWLIAGYLSLRLPIPRAIDRALSWLGMLSYSMYLNHGVVMSAASALLTKHNIVLTGLAANSAFTFCVLFPTVVASSVLTYYVIEYPFLGWRSGYTRPLAVVADAPREG